MGALYEAACLDCSHQFRAHFGGGLQFDDLHCTLCGQHEDIGHDKLPQPRFLYLEAVFDAICEAGGAVEEDCQKLDRRRKAFEASANDYDQTVERIIGRCLCGGQFALHAPVRCPVCKSANIEDGDVRIYYD